ncbi:hypothetical protein BOX15_Mlig028192g1 [Macrostomum lignano]|uniref:Uncharacterized protein n=1 Tax=Macrostomum lignano TaxID=282301 RepID=A0A267GFF5_9PLAT|nr:hypothetical protein BOX15_Mlig028192g1 [Macrostomum lignano]
MSAAVAHQSPLPPRLRIGRKKPHWLLADSPSAAEVDDPLAALRRWLAGLSDSQVSLLAVSDFDSEFRRDLELRRRTSGRPATSVAVRTRRPRSVRFVSQLESAASGSESDEDETELDAVSSVSDTEAAPRMPRSSLFKVSDCLPVDEASKTRALSTLRAVTGAGDPKMSVVSRRFCDSAWPRTPADFARPRSVAYGQNLRVHPDLAGAIRTSILEARPAFECVSAAGLAELDRRLPSLAKTRHDRVVDWLEEAG